MEPNWLIISIVIFLGVVLIIYLFRQNQKDEKEISKTFNNYKSSDEEESEFNDEQ